MPPIRTKSEFEAPSPPGSAFSGGGPAQGEIKLQRACVACRRSKVKCIHSGSPPCRRCADTNQECKFRLRADDETWRERTDDTLSRLANAVDTLLSRGPATGPIAAPSAGAPPNGHAGHPPGASFPSASHPAGVRARTVSSSTNGPGSTMGPPAGPNARYTMAHASPSYSATGSSPNAGGPGGAFMTTPGGSSISDASGSVAGPSRLPYLPPAPPTTGVPIGVPLTPAGSGSESALGHYMLPALTPGGTARSPLPLVSSGAAYSTGGPGSGLPVGFRRFIPPAIGPGQCAPSPALLHVGATSSPIFINAPQQGVKWMHGCTSDYAKATHSIGRDDPRLNAISMGVVPMDRARALYLLFADKLQPHCFGFPTYPADGNMTPLIISVILMCSSLHNPLYRDEYYPKLKNDCLETINPNQQVSGDMPLDPELGIGVEEITGACIAAAYLPSAIALRIAFVTRWWALGYFKNFEIERNVTLGECLTILPPFRQIDLVDKLRVWLAAYVAEAQQCFIADVPSLAPAQLPGPYIEALRGALYEQADKAPNGNTSNGSDPSGAASASISEKTCPMPDRQLTAHAGILSILMGAQRSQREGAGRTSPVEVARIAKTWTTWLEELERWRLDAGAHEDLSAATASAMDLSLTYHLARAHVGSLANEPEGVMHPQVAQLAAQDGAFQLAQSRAVGSAKDSAIAALLLASSKSSFADRLVYLPTFYHFLMSHAAGFLLLLVQRKWRALLAGESQRILEVVEAFVKTYVFEIAAYVPSTDPNAQGNVSNGAGAVHPALATAESLQGALRHVLSQCRSGPG